jgi:Leucine-rich repeat (LRR) protein
MAKLRGLRALRLDDNVIEDAAALGGLQNLTRLDLSGNRLSSLRVRLPKVAYDMAD